MLFRSYGVFQQPNVLGSFIATGLALALWLLLAPLSTPTRRRQLPLLALLAAFSALLVLIQSRAAWLGGALAAALLLCWLRAGELDALAFGGVTAASLGVAVAPLKLLLYVVTTALTAAIVAFSGAVGFIGLTVPHVARRLVGSRHRRLLPASALCGALFAVAADTLARTLFAPRELPVGVLTALLGVPVFLLLLYRKVNA